MRARICSLVNCSVNDTLIVRSNGSSPRYTRISVSTVCFMAKCVLSTWRRKRLRATSIFLASEISWSRLSSGILAIWLRYMRIGSLSSFRITSAGGGPSGRSTSTSPTSVAFAATTFSDRLGVFKRP